MVAIVGGFCTVLLFLFVPETFWDRTPRPHHIRKRQRQDLNRSQFSFGRSTPATERARRGEGIVQEDAEPRDFSLAPPTHSGSTMQRQQGENGVVRFLDANPIAPNLSKKGEGHQRESSEQPRREAVIPVLPNSKEDGPDLRICEDSQRAAEHNISVRSPGLTGSERDSGLSKLSHPADGEAGATTGNQASVSRTPGRAGEDGYFLGQNEGTAPDLEPDSALRYTAYYRQAQPKSFIHTLKPYSGRLSEDNWFRVAIRPFILFAYPSVLWSTVVYSLSVGWLIVLSEAVSEIYRDRDSYNFTALQTGLVYISPFVGGVLGTAVAGKLSDVIVRMMSRRNDGVYEPEFRLVMAIPIAISTTIGLMGFGWSVEERNAWIVPTLFFGIISFGCSLGSTTAITFCVDSYRQYAGEALVTLNFSKS